jgi:predicted alpha-1,6-mannanase (GH76 family)
MSFPNAILIFENNSTQIPLRKLEVFLIFPSQTPAVVFFSRVAQDFGGDLAIIYSIDMEVS